MSKFSDLQLKKKQMVWAISGLIVCLAIIGAVIWLNGSGTAKVSSQGGNGDYVILGMNDLGMHCYQKDFSSFLILPPANTLKVQVFRRGTSEAEPVNSGITVSYEIINNTFSVGKTNFWDYAREYGFDVQPNTGITGNTLKGKFKLDATSRFYEATAIPVTPYADGSMVPDPYQMARITVSDGTGKVLATTDKIVVPVSDEMKCNICHGETDTGLNILKAHDELSGTTLAQDLEKGDRYKCSDCHKDVALGQQGKEGVKPLSEAMHGFHADKMSQSNLNPPCYSCHPGPVTLCNRGAMYKAGFICGNANCHGTMENIAETQANGTRQAWTQEPDCGGCHGVQYDANPNRLYRDSFLQNSPSLSMNNIIQCESCHNSPHAEWVSTLQDDNLLPISLMGYASYINQCSVCHQGSGKMHRGTAPEE